MSEKKELLQVQALTKTFQLSSKQQKLEKTKEKVRTAVDLPASMEALLDRKSVV